VAISGEAQEKPTLLVQKPQNKQQQHMLAVIKVRNLMAKKPKSKVNEAGNYTKPTLRKQLFNKIKAGSRGGSPGQWSARKAQLLAKEYKAKGGGYRK
jgi:hypothetical protein